MICVPAPQPECSTAKSLPQSRVPATGLQRAVLGQLHLAVDAADEQCSRTGRTRNERGRIERRQIDAEARRHHAGEVVARGVVERIERRSGHVRWAGADVPAGADAADPSSARRNGPAMAGRHFRGSLASNRLHAPLKKCRPYSAFRRAMLRSPGRPPPSPECRADRARAAVAVRCSRASARASRPPRACTGQSAPAPAPPVQPASQTRPAPVRCAGERSAGCSSIKPLERQLPAALNRAQIHHRHLRLIAFDDLGHPQPLSRALAQRDAHGVRALSACHSHAVRLQILRQQPPDRGNLVGRELRRDCGSSGAPGRGRESRRSARRARLRAGPMGSARLRACREPHQPDSTPLQPARSAS